MKHLNIHQLAFCGILAAIYAVLTISTAAFAYGPIQFRLADALCILPFFAPVTGIGLTLGCLLANLFSTVSALDVIMGTAATALACMLTAKCRKAALAPLPNVCINAVMIGAMLSIVSTPQTFWRGFCLYALQVGVGELAVMYALGLPLLLFLRKSGLGQRIATL